MSHPFVLMLVVVGVTNEVSEFGEHFRQEWQRYAKHGQAPSGLSWVQKTPLIKHVRYGHEGTCRLTATFMAKGNAPALFAKEIVDKWQGLKVVIMCADASTEAWLANAVVATHERVEIIGFRQGDPAFTGANSAKDMFDVMESSVAIYMEQKQPS